jgi:CRISPR/Cas system-associated protein Cas7 (RAMP superfamily)
LLGLTSPPTAGKQRWKITKTSGISNNMLKYLYSILLVTNDKSEARIVVCETKNDEEEILRHIDRARHNVSSIARAEGDFKRYPITLNDYEL